MIRSYFKQHGLVSQQISSFNRFLEMYVQEVVKEHKENYIKVENQYLPEKMVDRDDSVRNEEGDVYYKITFDQVHVNSSPRIQESDESYQAIFPHEARIRNLTYATEIYVDVKLQKLLKKVPEKTGLRVQSNHQEAVYSELEAPKQVQAFLGKIPVMVRSQFCQLKSFGDQEILRNAKECLYDQGGYFIINGGEKVLIAQERMASNIVLVFHRRPPSKYSWVAEIRSQAENSNKPPQ